MVQDFLQDRYTSCHPTNSVKSLKARLRNDLYFVEWDVKLYYNTSTEGHS